MWAFVVLLVLMIPLIAVISDSPVGRALARRLERDGSDDAAVAQRLAVLEQEVERLASQVERVEEGTRFVERLLEERAGDRPGERSGSGDRLESGDSGG